MKNLFLGIWIIFMSVTMLAGILFPFQGVLLSIIGFFAGFLVLTDGAATAITEWHNNQPKLKYVVAANTLYANNPDAQMYLNMDNSYTSDLKQARMFDSEDEAEDFVFALAIKGGVSWSESDVEIMAVLVPKEN